MKKLGSTIVGVTLSWVAVLTIAGCSSDPAATADAPESTTATSSTAASAQQQPACAVAFTGPNPTKEDVEKDISALATDQNALYAQYSAALGNPAPAPTEATLTDQQVTTLNEAPAGALERLSSEFCTNQTLSSGLTARLDQALTASVPDSTEGASDIRLGLASISIDHPVSLLLSTTFDVCALGASQPDLTKETNPLAADPGAIAIVTNFCPTQADLFQVAPN